MQAIVVLLLFVGVVFVMHGIYEERLAAIEKKSRIEYRFVPRTIYEEQLARAGGGGDQDLSTKFHDMFAKESPWSDRDGGSAL
jgi:hypothetical protein